VRIEDGWYIYQINVAKPLFTPSTLPSVSTSPSSHPLPISLLPNPNSPSNAVPTFQPPAFPAQE